MNEENKTNLDHDLIWKTLRKNPKNSVKKLFFALFYALFSLSMIFILLPFTQMSFLALIFHNPSEIIAFSIKYNWLILILCSFGFVGASISTSLDPIDIKANKLAFNGIWKYFLPIVCIVFLCFSNFNSLLSSILFNLIFTITLCIPLVRKMRMNNSNNISIQECLRLTFPIVFFWTLPANIIASGFVDDYIGMVQSVNNNSILDEENSTKILIEITNQEIANSLKDMPAEENQND